MPFRTLGEHALTAVARLRLTPQEKQHLRDEADLAGLSMSELIRRRAFGRTVLAAADMLMVRELRRLGGLLKHVHNESRGEYSDLTAATLKELRGYIEQLSKGRV